MNPFDPPLVSACVLLIIFLGTWFLSIRHNNYSFVDVAWSLSFAPVVLIYGLLGGGWQPRRLLVAALVAMWSLRLGTYLWGRVSRHHPREDPRYAVLREEWKAHPQKAFLWFFLAQALLVWLLTLPVHLISRNGSPSFDLLELIGLGLWCAGLLGEALADSQLRRFKAEQGDASRLCRTGLWRYSRHPNYFFQSLLWWGLFLVALPVPWGWCSVAAPLAMLWFLLRVTGIPLTEKLAVASKGQDYLDYQATTSAFVPWFPKPSKHP